MSNINPFQSMIQALKNDPNATPEFRQQLDSWLSAIEEALRKAGAQTPNAASAVPPVVVPPASAPAAAQGTGPAAGGAPGGGQPVARAVTPPTEPQQVPVVPAAAQGAGPAAGGAPGGQPVARAVTPATGPQPVPQQAPTKSDGHGPNTVDITNTTGREQKYGLFLNGGSTTVPVYQITLKPGETGRLSFENGQGGFIAQANSNGAYQWDASRLEFFADANGVNNTNVSYITGRNASIQVTNSLGQTLGDSKSIANVNDPDKRVTYDPAGNPTITGWYDGASADKQASGLFLERQLGTAGAYIHPEDDRLPNGQNPMTMANTPSQHFSAAFGNA